MEETYSTQDVQTEGEKTDQRRDRGEDLEEETKLERDRGENIEGDIQIGK